MWQMLNYNARERISYRRHVCPLNVNISVLDEDIYTKLCTKMQHNHADMSRDQNGTGVYFARDYQSNLGNTMGRS